MKGKIVTEFIIRGSVNTHYITVDNKCSTISISRVSINGSKPVGLSIAVAKNISFVDAMRKINNIVKLDDEMFNLLSTTVSEE